MPLPDFELGPLEMQEVASSEPVTTPAMARVKVGRFNFLLRPCLAKDGTPRLFFRLDERGAPILRANHEAGSDAMKAIERIGNEIEKLPQGKLFPLLEPFLNRWGWKRTLLVQDPDNSFTILARLRIQYGYGCAAWEAGNRMPGADFRWGRVTSLPVSWLLRAPNAALSQEVEKWLLDPENEGGFALRWEHLECYEQTRLLIRFRDGDLDDFISVLRWITWNYSSLWPHSHEGRWLVRFEQRTGHLQKSVLCVRLPYAYEFEVDDLDIDIEKEAPQVALWLDALHAHFCPVFDEKMLRFKVVSDRDRRADYEDAFYVPMPSFHEQLEARINLRSWAQGKIPPDQILALLGETE